MQVTPGEQTRDTITAVGKNTGYKKESTLFIRKQNTVCFRGNSHRDAQQPAISSPGCSASPRDRAVAGASAVSPRQCLTIPSLVVFQLLQCFFFFFSLHNWGGNGSPCRCDSSVSCLCQRGLQMRCLCGQMKHGVLGS